MIIQMEKACFFGQSLKRCASVFCYPPSVRSRRVDLPTRLYESRDDKLSAVVDEVRFWRSVGRPALIGTLTVEQSEAISRRVR